MTIRTAGLLLLLGLATVVSAAEPAAKSRKRTLRNPELFFLYHSDVSRPLREMPVIPPLEEEGAERLHPVKLIRPPRPVPQGWVDPLVTPAMDVVTPQVSTTPGLNFEGVGDGVGGFSVTGAPPDTNGAPGLTQYVQWVNTSFAVFNKSTGARVFGPAAGNTLWQGFGGDCETNNSGDPVVMYDKAANRWVMTQFSINQSASRFFQCVAVSTTSDATGSYRRFAYNFPGFNDYPKGGVWPDGYYITFNMFNASGTAFTGGRVCALDRNQMLTASGTPGPIQCFQLSTTYGGLLPADLDGETAPPTGSPNYSVAFDDVGNNGLNLWKFHVDWTNSANSTFTGPIKITTAAFSPACGGGTCIPQATTTTQLDSLADRLMFRLAYRNFGAYESLVVNHSVTAGSSVSGVRWYEVRSPGGTPTLFQQGTFSPDVAARWMGSIAQDRQGNMLLGYSVSSGAMWPSIRYTGRLVSDPPGTMQAESTLISGTGSQTAGLTRWGDYSSMTIDPVDDCTFWFTSEYLVTSGSFNWTTRIGSFKFPGCGASPDFTIAASPAALSVVQGASGSTTVTVASSNGFNAAVGLSCTGLPAGASCGFNPASVTPPANGSATSALTIDVATSTAAGTYPIQVTGASGSLSHSASLSLTVTVPPVPDYSVSASPASLTVAQGASGTSTVTVASVNGFASAVGLSCTGLPAGASCGFSPASVTPPMNGSATSTLTVSIDAATATGGYSVSVVGTSGATTRATVLALTVTPPGGGPQTALYDATLRAPKCAVVGSSCDSGPSLLLGRGTKGPELNQPNTIASSCADGSSGTFHVDESSDRIKVQTLDGTPLAAGKTVRIDATVWAWTTPSADHLDLYYAANAASPAWTFITTLTPTASGARTLSATYTLPAGALQAVRARFRYNGSASACSTGSYDDHDDLVFAVSTTAPPPDFGVSASPTALNVAQGASGTSTVTVSSSNGFSSAVSLSCTGLPAGASCGFSPASVTPPANGSATSTLTVSVGSSTGTGSYSVSVVGTSAATTRTAAVTLTVTPAGGGAQTATYDATLRAPKCGVVGSSCDSGPSLLLGRGTRGPEPNQPNTIGGSCTDGTSGTFHSDESNDRIKVQTLDGTPLAAGKTVRIDATVWAWTTPSADHLDLYSAANAASPAWTFITTLTPTAVGAQTLSATYTLPAGVLQAVRARFRYNGSATACGAGSYNDHDDLVFAVQ